MAIIRKTGTETPAPAMRREWDPFRVMQDLLRWDPLRASWDPFRQLAPTAGEAGFVPQFEVKETKDAYVFKGDLPGIKDADLDISVTGNLLTIGGKREAEEREEGTNFFAYERSYGSFTRSFTLPEAADLEHIKAELKEGVLTLVLPKKPEMQPKRIQVKATAGEKQKS
jgi:HSP20 family protein